MDQKRCECGCGTALGKFPPSQQRRFVGREHYDAWRKAQTTGRSEYDKWQRMELWSRKLERVVGDDACFPMSPVLSVVDQAWQAGYAYHQAVAQREREKAQA